MVITLAVLLVVAGGYIGYGAFNNYENSRLTAAYQQGFLDAQNVINNNIINSLNTQGYVPFTAPTSEGETATFALGLIPDPTAAPAQAQ